jgi:YD repeat-containing protein
VVLLLVPMFAVAQAPASRVEVFDRYDPTVFSYDVNGVQGEHIDPRTLSLSWEVEDFVLPGNGGLDIVISRSFNRLAHTPSQMGHWYFGVPRVQIPTSPWRGPFDPASPAYGTFNAAWNNLYARTNNGQASVCERAGRLVDATVRGSINNVNKGGILFAAPLMLYIPGEGSKVLLEKLPDATQFPAVADYVTTDNWYAACLPPAAGRSWGGMRVVSPRGVSYVFDFIQYLVPGDYGLASTGGWVELGISSIEDADGNRIDYNYDLAPGGSALLQSITASDGRVVEFEYLPGSVLGVDLQGSPLALITAINIKVNGELYPIRYDYCDFSDYYLLKVGCTPLTLGAGEDLPVLHEVTYPNGLRTRYRYVADMYSANVLYEWGGFNFLLESVVLPTGGTIQYRYHQDYSPVLQNSASPAPRLATRTTSGPDVTPGTWSYDYRYARHIETTTISGPANTEERQFYEGLGTYEFRIARYPGQHAWPGTAPTDYDEVMGRLRRFSIRANDAPAEWLAERYQYTLPNPIGSSHYGGNWLGWPTLTLAQTRRVLVNRVITTDLTGSEPRDYSVFTPAADFDPYGFPRVRHERGHNSALADSAIYRRRQLDWYHDPEGWFIGLPAAVSVGNARLEYDYWPGSGRLRRATELGRTTEYEYDAEGNLSTRRWQRDGLDYRTTYASYRRGLPQLETRSVDPATGGTATVRRRVDGFGHIRWQEDTAGNRTLYRYDPMGRLLQTAAPGVAPLNVAYTRSPEGFWNGVEQTQGSWRRQLQLDGFGRGILLRDFAESRPAEAPLARSWRFGPAGRLVYASDPWAWTGESANPPGTAYAYDALDRLTTMTATADNSQQTFCYTAACNTGDYSRLFGADLFGGRLLTDADGYETAVAVNAYEFPAGGEPSRVVQQLTRATDPEGVGFSVTEIERDIVQKVLAVTQSGPHAAPLQRRFVYNAQQQVIEEQHPESGLTRHQYDERGNRIATTYADGTVYRWRYDGLDRLVAVDYPAADFDVSLEYDPAGHLARVRNPLADWRYQYDPAGQLLEEVLTVADTQLAFRYDYDELGHLRQIEYPGGRAAAVDTDEHGRARAIAGAVTAAAYWPDGMLRELLFANGVTTRVEQNARRQESRRWVDGAAAGMLLDQRYRYDPRGNPLMITDMLAPGLSRSLGYDGQSRLTRADGDWGSGEISYDAVGNIRHRALGNVDLRYEYSTSGNTLSAIVANEAQRFAVEHDARGRVIADGLYDFVYGPDAQLTGIGQLPDLRYGYDGNGHRTLVTDADGERIDAYDLSGKLIYRDACNAGGTTSEFVYLGDELVARNDEPCAVSCHP